MTDTTPETPTFAMKPGEVRDVLIGAEVRGGRELAHEVAEMVVQLRDECIALQQRLEATAGSVGSLFEALAQRVHALEQTPASDPKQLALSVKELRDLVAAAAGSTMPMLEGH